MAAGPASRPWRRFLRFSLLGLIVLVLVIGAWLGWIGRSARIQHEAVAAIERAGGVFLYHSDFKESKRWWPDWLVDRVGVDSELLPMSPA